MNRTIPALALAAAAMLALAACGAGEGADDGATESASAEMDAPTTADEPSPSPSPTEDPLEAADGTDYDACSDGECEVLVEEGVEFPIDSKYGMDTFAVTAVDGDVVSVAGYGPGTEIGFTMGVGGQGSANGALLVSMLAIEGDQAVMQLSPA